MFISPRGCGNGFSARDGWRRLERDALVGGARVRTEVLWINPACAAALDRQQLPLLAGGVA